MKQSEIILSTVALTTVMMMSSLHFTSDVQAAERPAVTSEVSFNYETPFYAEVNGVCQFIGYVSDSYTDPNIYDANGNVIGDKRDYMNPSGGSYNSQSTIVKVSDSYSSDSSNYDCEPIVSSYKERVTVNKDETLFVDDLNIKISNMPASEYELYFDSSSRSTTKYTKRGNYDEKVYIRTNSGIITSIDVNITVVSEQAPEIIGVHNVKGQRIYWAKNSGFTNYIADLNFDPREDPDWDNRLYKPEKLILLGVKAKDCDGNDITKNIKISGFNKKKYNKKQKVTLSVTDSEGRTTTATCSVYIKDPVKKMDKYMYNAYGGMYSDTFTYTYWLGMKAKDASTWDIEFFKWMEKVHVVGRHENGEWLVEKNGKTYFLDRLSETYTDMPKHIYSYIYSSYLDVECRVIESYGNKKVGGLGYNRFERDPNSEYFGCTDKFINTFDKDTVECCSMTVAYIRNVLEGNRPIDKDDKGRRGWFTMEDRGYVKDIYNPSNTTRLFCDDYLPLCIERGEIKINEETARAFGVPIKHLKKMKTYLSDPVGLKIGLGSKISDVKYIYKRNGKYTKYNW